MQFEIEIQKRTFRFITEGSLLMEGKNKEGGRMRKIRAFAHGGEEDTAKEVFCLCVLIIAKKCGKNMCIKKTTCAKTEIGQKRERQGNNCAFVLVVVH